MGKQRGLHKDAAEFGKPVETLEAHSRGMDLS